MSLAVPRISGYVSGIRASLVLVLAAALSACGSGGADSPAGPSARAATMVLSTTLARLDTAREGHYQAWLLDATGGARPIARFAEGGSLDLSTSASGSSAVEVTLERPGDVDAVRSAQVLLRGMLRDGRAELAYAGAITQGDLLLHTAPGQFTMFTPSDNEDSGYPSHEEAGVWLFNMSPGVTSQRDYYVRLTQLQAGWTYEGWMVRDIGQGSAIWLSYGKFLPDWTGAVNTPDDTGWGPFSGVTDFRRARLEDFPGDDWISNPLRLPWNPALRLPLDLREKNAQGTLRWTHVISVEPASDRGEPLTTERPFFLRPYADLFGDQGPGVARRITFRGESLPRGTVDVR